MPEQLPLFTIDQEELTQFLTRCIVLEDEIERLNKEKALLTEEFAVSLPMRAVKTAIKVVRAQRKLAAHPEEAMPRVHQSELESLVDQHLDNTAAMFDELLEHGEDQP